MQKKELTLGFGNAGTKPEWNAYACSINTDLPSIPDPHSRSPRSESHHAANGYRISSNKPRIFERVSKKTSRGEGEPDFHLPVFGRRLRKSTHDTMVTTQGEGDRHLLAPESYHKHDPSPDSFSRSRARQASEMRDVPSHRSKQSYSRNDQYRLYENSSSKIDKERRRPRRSHSRRDEHRERGINPHYDRNIYSQHYDGLPPSFRQPPPRQRPPPGPRPFHVTPETSVREWRECDNYFCACICPPCMMYAHEGDCNISVLLNLLATCCFCPCGSICAVLHADMLNETEIKRIFPHAKHPLLI